MAAVPGETCLPPLCCLASGFAGKRKGNLVDSFCGFLLLRFPRGWLQRLKSSSLRVSLLFPLTSGITSGVISETVFWSFVTSSSGSSRSYQNSRIHPDQYGSCDTITTTQTWPNRGPNTTSQHNIYVAEIQSINTTGRDNNSTHEYLAQTQKPRDVNTTFQNYITYM